MGGNALTDDDAEATLGAALINLNVLRIFFESLLHLIITHYEDDTPILYYAPPLGKSGPTVLDFGFHVIFDSEDVSAQVRPNGWKANMQDIIHIASLVDWSIEPESLVETIWDVVGNLWVKVTAPYMP